LTLFFSCVCDSNAVPTEICMKLRDEYVRTGYLKESVRISHDENNCSFLPGRKSSHINVSLFSGFTSAYYDYFDRLLNDTSDIGSIDDSVYGLSSFQFPSLDMVALVIMLWPLVVSFVIPLFHATFGSVSTGYLLIMASFFLGVCRIC